MCETLRSVSVSVDLAESVWYPSYGDYCDFYMLDGDILNLILTIKHRQDTTICELAYTYHENSYVYPAIPKVIDKKPVKNYTIHAAGCSVGFIQDMVRLLIWDSISALTNLIL